MADDKFTKARMYARQGKGFECYLCGAFVEGGHIHCPSCGAFTEGEEPYSDSNSINTFFYFWAVIIISFAHLAAVAFKFLRFPAVVPAAFLLPVTTITLVRTFRQMFLVWKTKGEYKDEYEEDEFYITKTSIFNISVRLFVFYNALKVVLLFIDLI